MPDVIFFVPKGPFTLNELCDNGSNLKISDIDAFVFYEKPFIKFERLLETYLKKVPSGFKSFKLAIPLWIKEKLFQRQLIVRNLFSIENFFCKSKTIFLLYCSFSLGIIFYLPLF